MISLITTRFWRSPKELWMVTATPRLFLLACTRTRGSEYETVPVGLRKNEGFGIPNTIFEVDLANDAIDWEGKFTKDDMCQLLYKWINMFMIRLARKRESLSTYVISLKLWPPLLNASCMWLFSLHATCRTPTLWYYV